MARAGRRPGLRRAAGARPRDRRAVRRRPAPAAGPRRAARAAGELPRPPSRPRPRARRPPTTSPPQRRGRRHRRHRQRGRRDRGGRHGRGHPHRLGGHRRHHLLHQHLATRPSWSAPACWPGTRSRAGLRVAPTVKTSLAPGLAGGDRLPRGGRADGAARGARLRPGRLRLHDLHRQLRAARRGRRRRPSRRTTWSSRPSCRATATSRAASIRSPAPATSPRRRWWSRSRSPGAVDIDLTTEPLGTGVRRRSPCSSPTSGRRPTRSARSSASRSTPELFRRTYAIVFEGDERWRALPIPDGERYAWDAASTYVAQPPFFDGLAAARPRRRGHRGRPRAGRPRRLGHHRPHLPGRLDRAVVARRPVAPGARRRPARVQLVRRAARPPRGDDARHVRQHPAAQRARRAPRRARTRSTSRRARRRSSTTPPCATRPRACRWSSSPAASTAPARRATGRPRAPRCSASGPSSPRATSASIAPTWSGMGVLPLQFLPGDSAASLGLTGRETLRDPGPRRRAAPRQRVTVVATADPAAGGDGRERRFEAIARLDGPIDVDYSRPAASCRRSCGGWPPSPA